MVYTRERGVVIDSSLTSTDIIVTDIIVIDDNDKKRLKYI